MIYFACDEGCTEAGWTGTILSDTSDIGPGVDIALDAEDHPRFVYTFGYNIGLAHCDDERCELPEAAWDLAKVELGQRDEAR